nr:MAG TPA: helix-turn-helix domain protein [Caudoviricetes sp.]
MGLYKEGGVMAARLTDKQKKKIIADYVELGSYNAVARKHGVSNHTVKRIALGEAETSKKVQHKKEQNTADILSYMESQKGEVIKMLDSYLAALNDPKKIERAGVVQLATALGIVIDKYTATSKNEQAMQKLDDLLGKIGGVI